MLPIASIFKYVLGIYIWKNYNPFPLVEDINISLLLYYDKIIKLNIYYRLSYSYKNPTCFVQLKIKRN